MVVVTSIDPSEAQVKQLHSKVANEVSAIGEENFLKSDLTRLKNEAHGGNWMRRFLLHQDLEMDAAFKMAMDALKVRFQYKIDDIHPDMFGEKFLSVGGFQRGYDKDGCRIFVIKPKTRTDKKTDELKKLLLYWFDRLERESEQKITVFVDLTGCGIRDMDMDFTRFLVSCLQEYYPNFLNYLIMFEMPWILNAQRKVIISWLPPKSQAVVKFLDQKSLPEYIAPDQALVEWGATDANKKIEIEASSTNESSALEEIRRKFRLRCFVAAGDASDKDFITPASSGSKSPDEILEMLNDIANGQKRLESKLSNQKYFLILQFLLVLSLCCFIIFAFKGQLIRQFTDGTCPAP